MTSQQAIRRQQSFTFKLPKEERRLPLEVQLNHIRKKYATILIFVKQGKGLPLCKSTGIHEI